MTTILATPSDASAADSDAWASHLFDRMLDQSLSIEEFEDAVASHWRQARFMRRAPQTAARLRAAALGVGSDAGYASDAPELGFRSQWLVGVPGRPGAIHIQAPPERVPGAALMRLNRQPHQHDSGRIALVTHGRAVFHVQRELPGGGRVIVDCPVTVGDLVFWPAWTPHTFDACEGFWLVSAMADYVSPAADGFVMPIPETQAHPDVLPRMSYQEFVAAAG